MTRKEILEKTIDFDNAIHRIVELEAQIEKMKCCVNCKHSRTEYEHCKTHSVLNNKIAR